MVDTNREESIRRWPVWFAKWANRLLRWTNDACAGGCGYPVTRQFVYELEVIDQARVVMLICSLGGECERIASSDPRDDLGRSYADFRPDIVEMVREHPETRLVPMSQQI